MLPISPVFALVNKKCHRICHRHSLQRLKRCAYHHRPGGCSAVRTTRSISSPFARPNIMFMSSYSCSHQPNAETPNNSNAPSPENRDHDDDHAEAEYSDLVIRAADEMRSAVRQYVAEYSRERSAPSPIKLVGILATTTTHPISSESDGQDRNHYVNDNYGNETYSEQIANCCLADGIAYEPWRVPPTREALERAIHHANERLDVHGVLVFYPVFDKLSRIETARKTYKCQSTGVYFRSMDDYFRDLVASHKDVEGYCRKGLRIQETPETNENTGVIGSVGKSDDHIVKAEELGPIYPCTALAVYKILESFHFTNGSSTADPGGSGKQFENMTMTIVNRSEVLGLPLATMLSNRGATVYSINIDSILQFLPYNGRVQREPATTTVEQCIRKSSVVVSGVPSPTFKIPTKWIASNATLINVANESNFEEDALCYNEAHHSMTYVPHVGRVTVAALEFNLMCLHQNYHMH